MLRFTSLATQDPRLVDTANVDERGQLGRDHTLWTSIVLTVLALLNKMMDDRRLKAGVI